MANGISWILASVVAQFGAWSGWRLDVLLVRVVRAGVAFVGLVLAVSPPVARLERADVRMDVHECIDTEGYAVEETSDRADGWSDAWAPA